jgi:hypothetical protein
MNKIPIEAGAACFISSFMSVVPNSSSVIAIYFFFESHSFSNQFFTVLHLGLMQFKKGKIKIRFLMAHRQF